MWYKILSNTDIVLQRLISVHKKFLLLSFTLFFAVILSGQGNYNFDQVTWLPPTAKINKIIQSPRSGIYVLTDLGLYLKDKQDQIVYSMHGRNVSDLAEMKEGEWIISCGHQILDKNGNILCELDSSQVINAIFSQGAVLWIGTSKGLYKYYLSAKRWEEQTSRNSDFKKSKVNFIHKDNGGNLWIGTEQGDYRITKDKWKKYNNGKNVSDQFENNEGVWFVSEDDMWLVDLNNRYYPVGLGKGLTKGRLNDFTIDNKGNLYFASDQLTTYNPYTNKIHTYEDEIAFLTQKTTALLWTSNSLLIGTDHFGLYELKFTNDPQMLSINMIVQSLPTCQDRKDGVVEAYIKGGTPPYAFKWEGYKETTSSLKNVAAGSLTLEVTDATGTVQKKSVNISSIPITEIEISEIKSPEPQKKNGSIRIKEQKGYTYLWDEGQTGPLAENLGKGTYKVSAKNAQNCVTTRIIELQEEVSPAPVVQSNTIPTPPQNTRSGLNIKEFTKGKTIILDQINFMADSTDVTKESLPTLNELLDLLKTHPTLKIEIGGHTNTIPPHDYCDKLSTARAKKMAEYFYRQGIPTERITYKGYGKRKPLTNSTTEEGRRLNQRVEIVVLEN